MLISSQTYSQTTILNNKDTLVCFTVPQSKFLLKKVYEADENAMLNNVCENQLAYYDSVVTSNKSVIAKQSSIIKNQLQIIDLKTDEIKIEEDKLKQSQKETRKQKAYKLVSIGVGGAISCLLAYMLIMK